MFDFVSIWQKLCILNCVKRLCMRCNKRIMQLSMVCPRMGGGRATQGNWTSKGAHGLGFWHHSDPQGWEIWLDRHFEKSRGSRNEWRVGAPSWKIPRIRLSQFTASKDVNDGWTKVLCCFIFEQKCCFFMFISALSWRHVLLCFTFWLSLAEAKKLSL